MSALLFPKLACPTPDRSEGQGASPMKWLDWIFWIAVAIALGLLLFCHGCHGDEDNELFGNAQQKRPRLEAVGVWENPSHRYFGTRMSIG